MDDGEYLHVKHQVGLHSVLKTTCVALASLPTSDFQHLASLNSNTASLHCNLAICRLPLRRKEQNVRHVWIQVCTYLCAGL